MVSERSLTLGVILPHTKIFGGVKRFFEIGNILIGKGHRFLVFTLEGRAPDWFPFQGEVIALKYLSDYSFDALFITEPEYLDHLQNATTTLRIFYAVLQRRYIRKVAATPGLTVFANSGSLYAYLGGKVRPNVIKCIGGIDVAKFPLSFLLTILLISWQIFITELTCLYPPSETPVGPTLLQRRWRVVFP